jgi:protein-L-isoaspartate(D-aspartate) O-methyltransferase
MRRLVSFLLLVLVTLTGGASPGAGDPAAEGDEWTRLRERMVQRQIAARGIDDERLLEAMRAVPRHELVPEEYRHLAYADHPLPIGRDQTISQPYIVAYMTDKLALDGSEKVLEIGTGSGYQAAVLALLALEVYTIEIVPELAARASADLRRLGHDNVQVHAGDGYRGWPEKAPFDAIIITAAPPRVPEPLVEQLAVGGRMILPVGESFQELVLITRDEEGVRRDRLIPVRFVPMTGEVRERR